MPLDNQANNKLLNLHFDKKRFRVKLCPCGKSNKDGKFVPYIGFENKGYCHSCGETYLPEFSKLDNQLIPSIETKRRTKIISKPASFIPVDLFKQSLKNYQKNYFVKFLIAKFGIKITEELIAKYLIGSSKHWNGSTVFWQVDSNSKIRMGKIMLYNPINGKRIKEPRNYITRAHSALKLPAFNLRQCLFGEHLLNSEATKPIAIVESEKTAIISSVFFPQLLWLASGSLSNLSNSICRVLENRDVILFPDANGFEKWSKIANELSTITNFKVSDLLERNVTMDEKIKGYDLVDYLLK